jgi:hypothetical protein
VFLDRTDPTPSRGVHVHFAGEPIGAGRRLIAPPVSAGVDVDGIPTIALEDLLIMKLAAFRSIDRVHVRDMLRVGLIDDAAAEQIPPEIRPRLEEIRANPDG